MLTKLHLFFEEGAIKSVGFRVTEDLKAIEYLNGAATLNTDYTPKDPPSSTSAASTAVVQTLSLHTRVVIRDVDDHQRMELERQPTARRRRHSHRPKPPRKTSPLLLSLSLSLWWFRVFLKSKRRRL